MKARRGGALIEDPAAIERASSLTGCPLSEFTRVVTDEGAIMRAWSKRTGKRLSGADARKVKRALRDALGVRRSDGTVEVMDRIGEEDE